MTRATWCAAAGDRGRSYHGAHRAEATRSGLLVVPRAPRVSPRFGRGLRIAVALAVGYWATVTAAAVFGGLWPAVGAALGGVWLLVLLGLAAPSGWWR